MDQVIKNKDIINCYLEKGKTVAYSLLVNTDKRSSDTRPHLKAYHSKVDSIFKKYKSIKKNSGKPGHEINISNFKNEVVQLPQKGQPKKRKLSFDTAPESEFMLNVEALNNTTKDLAAEICSYKDANKKLEEENTLLKRKIRNKTLSNERISQTARHKIEKMYKLKLLNKNYEIKRLKSSKMYYEEKVKKLNEQKQKLQANISELQNRIGQLIDDCSNVKKLNEDAKKEIDDILGENEYLRSLIEDDSKIIVYDENQRQYSADMQKCIYELLDSNVSVAKIGTVLSACLKLANKEVNRIPAKSTILDMNFQRLVLAQNQIDDKLNKNDSLCLLTDETSKQGKKYMGYEATDGDGSYWVLGLREICTKSSGDTLDTLKQLLGDIDEVSRNTGSESTKLFMQHIVATMSDRAATETKFNTLLEEFRHDILPVIDERYEDLSGNEAQPINNILNFFCGLHSLVHIAETSNKALINAESGIFVGEVPKPDGTFKISSESGTTRLVRSASKAFAAGGDEKSGCYAAFSVFVKPFLRGHRLKSLPLKTFRGARFNILFSNAACVYFLHKQMTTFLTECTSADNRLLKCVLQDLQTPEFVAGVKCLGLISKLLTCPLWNAIEDKDVNILDMNLKYQEFIQTIENASNNLQHFITGELYFGEIQRDCIFEKLVQPSDIDNICEVILAVLLPAVGVTCKKLFADHLPGGSHSAIVDDENMRSKLKCVPKSNVFAESVFGRLDQIMRQKPSITTIASEAYIMFANNKTLEWLNSKDENEQKRLIAGARKDVRKVLRKFKERKAEIYERRRQMLEENTRKQKEARQNKERQIEQFTQDMIEFSLWQTECEVDNQVKSYETKSMQLKALKAQLRFRHHVLQQEPDNKAVFNFTKLEDGKRRNLTIDELSDNVKQLVKNAQVKDQDQGGHRHVLVGRRVRHRFDTGNGVLNWYNGKVISQVTATNTD